MRVVAGVFLLFFIVLPLSAWEGSGDDLVVKVAIFGPGDKVYSWFGHNALIIDNTNTRESRFYNYGLFSFNDENFFRDFIFGRMLYSSGAFPTGIGIVDYVSQNRDVVLYTLDLPAEKREEIKEFAETSILPENKDYLYHIFRDNCSTRIRDIINIATDGQFWNELGEKPGRFTFRQHARCYIWFSFFWDWTLNFLMGRDVDRPVTVWDEMYLPLEVAHQIMDFNYRDAYGFSHKLVSDVETVYLSQNRPVVLKVPQRHWSTILAFSLIISLFICLLFLLQAKKPVAGQIGLGICYSVFGLCFGLAGFLLFFTNFFTNHDYTFHNANLLFCNPIILITVPFGIRYALSKNYNKRLFPETLLRMVWFLMIIGVIISIFVRQDGLTAKILILPIAIVFSLEPIGLKKILNHVFWRWL